MDTRILQYRHWYGGIFLGLDGIVFAASYEWWRLSPFSREDVSRRRRLAGMRILVLQGG